MSTALTEFLSHQGWENDAARAGLFEHWREIVGEDVAEHVHVESWSDGQLVLRADSTAWATQVRLLTASLLERVRAALGPDVVESVHVKGPQAPSWRAGPRVVKGRGPRDTYG
jgi:predicted nucleic acid-binding Zn ribbon protein